MKEFIMDWTCSQNGETKNTCRILEEEPLGIQLFGRVRRNERVTLCLSSFCDSFLLAYSFATFITTGYVEVSLHVLILDIAVYTGAVFL
jgi:hypothetical protein